MKLLRSRAAASMSALAALAMTATPVLAHGYGGWGRHHHHRHDDGIDGGDVLAGLLIVGGIAAIANAASQSAKEGRADEPYRYLGGPDYSKPEDRDYSEAPGGDEDDAVPDYGADNTGIAARDDSFDDAVSRCSDELERGDRRIDSVDNIGRADDRYSVEGRLEDGRGFTCSVDRDGRVRSVAVDGGALI